jgi:Xaa-Pro dipeptidase
MAFHIILGIWEEKVGFEADATIRITEKGYEPLYEFPNKLFVK